MKFLVSIVFMDPKKETFSCPDRILNENHRAKLMEKKKTEIR